MPLAFTSNGSASLDALSSGTAPVARPVASAAPPAQRGAPRAEPLRVVVSLDPADLASAHVILSAAMLLLRAEDGVEVALALPDHVSADAAVIELVAGLCRDLAEDPGALPDLVVYGETEAAELPAVLRVAASADPRQTAHAVALLSAMAQQVWDRASGAQPTAAPSPATPPPAHTAAPARSTAVYLGNDRLLVTTEWGAKIYCSAADLSLTPDLVAAGVVDPGLTAFLLRSVRAGMICVDVGANIGVFTVLMAQLCGPSGRVLAYEVNPRVLALLRDNVSVNYVGPWVEIHEEAAWSSVGEVTMNVSEVFQGNTSVYQPNAWYLEAFPQDTFSTVTVPAVPLDNVLLTLPHVDIVKIDVEGADHHVLEGMAEALRQGRVDTVVFEVNRQISNDDERRRLSALLTRLSEEGWAFSLLDHSGRLQRLDLATLLRLDFASSVVLRRP